MLTLLGMLGSVLFCVACIPAAWDAVRLGRNPGVPILTAWLLFLALLTYTTWCFLAFGFHLPFLSGAIEIVCWGLVLLMHYFPRVGVV